MHHMLVRRHSWPDLTLLVWAATLAGCATTQESAHVQRLDDPASPRAIAIVVSDVPTRTALLTFARGEAAATVKALGVGACLPGNMTPGQCLDFIPAANFHRFITP